MSIVLDKIQILNFFQQKKTKKQSNKSTKCIIANPRKIKLAFKKTIEL